MPISIACSNGHKLRVRDELAGKRVRCPKCQEIIAVPMGAGGPRAASDVPDPGYLIADEPGDVASGPRALPALPPRGPRTRKRARARASVAWKMPVVIGGGVGLAAIGLALLMVFLRRGPDPAPAASPTEGSSLAPLAAIPSTTGTPRRYPSLPDAVTGMPYWVDASAPFDVTRFLAVPPAEENAAPLYLDALFEFSDEMADCFPEADKQQRGPQARERTQNYEAFQRAREAGGADKASRDLDEMAEQLITQFDNGFRKLALAQQRPRCVFESSFEFDSLLPHSSVARQVVRIGELRIERELKAGQFDRAIDDSALLLRLSRDLRPRGVMISQLVSMATAAVTFKALTATLAAPELKPEHGQRILEILQQHMAEAADPYPAGVQAEYLMNRKTLYDLQHRTGAFSRERVQQKGYRDPDAVGRVLGDTMGMTGSEASAQEFDAMIRSLNPARYSAEMQAQNEFYRSLLAAADRGYQERSQAFQTALANIQKSPLAKLFVPNMDQYVEAIARDTARQRATLCLAALHRWQFDHTEPPPDLLTLVEAVGMEQIPLDPYSNQPLLMTVLDGQPVIYSVGSDGVDNRAMTDWDLGKRPGDFIFRLQHAQQ